jgi:predicted nucleic acid-binding protein
VLLLDNSAWARRNHSLVRERLAGLIEDGAVGVCLPFLLEAGYSARSGSDHAQLLADLSVLLRVEIDREIEALALRAQEQLAQVGHHRLAPSDVVIAACAHQAGAGVLHYDRDYDLITEHTELRFECEWLAPAGSLP